MGQVWLAEQTAPIQRQVALKLIKVGRYDDSVLQRFYAERQALAMMDHPSIAKVFDAGATPDGQPYFVMEYVPGQPITDYCDRNRVKIRERLELFVKVCEGVQHAHQKAIMHRDLKPANILVIEVDGKAVPRIIDFGLAKAASQQIDGQTMFTQAGAWVGTPGYMSPEQADPSVLDVDTRTDVYSLGAVLYVLLTGFLPVETKDRRKRRFEEFLLRLRDEDPPRPSTRVGKDKGSSKTAAEVRSTEPKHLVSQLRGDLDRITLKALEKNRAHRYGSPTELAADLRRYLNHEPVSAVPASALYRFQKYVRRHRLAVAIAATLVLLGAAFVGSQQVQIRRVSLERDRANQERDRANRIANFMSDMFKVSDPRESRGNSITARDILDKASTDIARGLARDPDVQSQMLLLMAHTFTNLGLYSRARELAQQALDTRIRYLRPDDPKTLESMSMLGLCFQNEGHFTEAEKFQAQALAGERRVLGPEDAMTLRTMDELGYTWHQQGRYVEAEKLHREVLEIQRRILGPEDRQTSTTMSMLALDISRQGRYPEAEKLHRETLELRTRVFGTDDPFTLIAMSNLAQVLHSEKRYAEAEKLEREELERDRLIYGPEHPNTLRTMDSLSNEVSAQGRNMEAEKMKRETLAIQRRVLGNDSPQTILTMSNLAALLDDEGHYAEAEKLERETLERERRILGPKHPETIDSIYDLACYTARNGKREETLSLLQEAVDNGYSNPLMATDPDLKSLHGDPRFATIVAHAKKHNALAQEKQ
jgi:eukaryotic-like serine/threonine-protein kinase